MGVRGPSAVRGDVGGFASRPLRPARLTLLVLLAAISLLVGSAAADTELPDLSRRVTDQADLLSPQAEQRLEQMLGAYEKKTGHQFAFVSIPSLDGDPIEDFSIRLAEKWKLGDEKRDDGLILLVSKADKKMRIEVGYGLEGAVTDALSAQIIRNQLRPAFRAGDFDGGVTTAMGTLMKAASGEAVRVEPPPQKKKRSGGFSLARLLPFLIFFGLMFGGGFSSRRRRGGMGLAAPLILGGGMRRGGFGGGGFGGGGFGGGGGGFGGGGASGGW